MSQLILAIVRCPESAPVEERRVAGGEFSLGRGADADWRLHDPTRVLSKRHCLFEFSGGAWNVHDLSTNGTFYNHAPTPLGSGAPRSLNNGDRLTLGPYEIEVSIVEAPSAGAAWSSNPWSTAVDGDAPQAGPASRNSGALFPDDLQLTEDFGPVTPDHGSATSSSFKPPVPAPQPFPTDLDLGFEPDPSPVAPVPPTGPPSTLAAAPGPTTPALPAPPSDIGEAQGARRLLEGAGIANLISRSADQHPDRLLQRAGEMLRDAVAGLRALLVSRAEVKREFRIQPTALQIERNNPLKFAANDQQALAALLDPEATSQAALRETIEDLLRHQAATLAATQAAARTLLERLRPEALEAQEKGAGLLPGSRERRLWDAYRQRHAQMTAEFDDDFDSAFGKAFARAYEKAAARQDFR